MTTRINPEDRRIAGKHSLRGLRRAGDASQSRDILGIIYGLASSAWWQGLRGMNLLVKHTGVGLHTLFAISTGTLPEPRTDSPWVLGCTLTRAIPAPARGLDLLWTPAVLGMTLPVRMTRPHARAVPVCTPPKPR